MQIELLKLTFFADHKHNTVQIVSDDGTRSKHLNNIEDVIGQATYAIRREIEESRIFEPRTKR